MTAEALARPLGEPTRRDWIAVLSAMLGAFMAVLDIQITNSSLKDIQGALAAIRLPCCTSLLRAWASSASRVASAAWARSTASLKSASSRRTSSCPLSTCWLSRTRTSSTRAPNWLATRVISPWT